MSRSTALGAIVAVLTCLTAAFAAGAQSPLPGAAPCGGAHCVFLPLASQPDPSVRVVSVGLEANPKTGVPFGAVATLQSTGGETLYDVTGEARVRVGVEELTVPMDLDAPAIPPGQYAFVSGTIANPAGQFDVAVLSFRVTGYTTTKTPASVGLPIVEAGIDCVTGSFRYVARNDTLQRVGNLYIGPRQPNMGDDPLVPVVLASGETITLRRPIGLYDLFIYCGGEDVPPVPTAFVQGQVVP